MDPLTVFFAVGFVGMSILLGIACRMYDSLARRHSEFIESIYNRTHPSNN